MAACRLVVTAETEGWARTAGPVTTGSAASVIGCDAEAGIERPLGPDDPPDGRPGVSLLLFAFNRDALQKAAINRVGQCVLTCPTTACYNGLPLVKDKTIRIGGNLRFFGDGFQFSKKLEGRRYWRLPVMDGTELPAVEEATRVGIRAACRPGVLRISAGNYGGNLGPFHLHLHKLLGG